MVRGPAAVLALPLAALAYLALAPVLPALPEGDATTLVAGSCGLLAVAAAALSLLLARDERAAVALVAFGGGLVMAALNAAGVGAVAGVPEALFAAAAGLLLARALHAPLVVVAVPVFVAVVDTWSVLDGPTERLNELDDPVDALTLDLPAWGGQGSAGHLGLVDVLFLAMFASWAFGAGFRQAATIAGLVLGLLGTLVVGVLLDEAVPALPLLAAGMLVPNLDLLPGLLRRAQRV